MASEHLGEIDELARFGSSNPASPKDPEAAPSKVE